MHATLCDYLADVVQNAIEAGASTVMLNITENRDRVEIAVDDNGKGMDAAQQARAWDPFHSEPGKHDRRRVGLGLPLLRQAVETVGGGISLASEIGRGTRLSFHFDARHVDTPPRGDLPLTLLGLMTHDGDYELTVKRQYGERAYQFSRGELRDALGDLREAPNLVLLKTFLHEQEADLTNESENPGAAATAATAGEETT